MKTNDDICISIKQDGVTYDVPISARHMQLFDRRHGEGSAVKLYKMLASDCNSYAAIGKEFGLSRERIRQIYQIRLAPWLPAKDGRQRQRVCRLTVVQHQHRRKHYPSITLKVWIKARTHKCAVEPVLTERKTGHKFRLPHALRINGKLCIIKSSSSQFRVSPKSTAMYAPCSIARSLLGRYDYIIVYHSTNRYWILPTSVIPTHQKGEFISIYLPLYRKNPGYNKIFPKVQWEAFENAWHILGNK